MITIANLKKSFGETIACDIPSLTINDGDILGLVGNNGAGKTTLFRMMLDLLKPDAGEVENRKVGKPQRVPTSTRVSSSTSSRQRNISPSSARLPT